MRTLKYRIGRIILFLLVYSLWVSCDMIEYHPYDTSSKGQPANLNATNINQIENKDDDGDTIRFAFMGDTQRWYDETSAFVKEINQRKNIDFVIHGGDISDFGMSKEYLWVHNIMKSLRVPYVALIGNHDIVGHGKDVYKEFYGDFNFAFKFKNTRFICLNTNALEFDYSTPVPDFDFMTRFLTDTTDIEQTVVVMHSPPFDDQFNNNSSLMFNYILEHYKNLRFCLHAHRHQLSVNDYFSNGIKYYGCDDIAGRNYLLFTLTPKSYSYEVVYF